jgi:glutaredoxin
MKIFYLIRIPNVITDEKTNSTKLISYNEENMRLHIIGLENCTFSKATKKILSIDSYRSVDHFTGFKNIDDIEYIEINEQIKEQFKEAYERITFPFILFNNKFIGGNDVLQEIINNIDNIDNVNQILDKYKNSYTKIDQTNENKITLSKLTQDEIKRLKQILINK